MSILDEEIYELQAKILKSQQCLMWQLLLLLRKERGGGIINGNYKKHINLYYFFTINCDCVGQVNQLIRKLMSQMCASFVLHFSKTILRRNHQFTRHNLHLNNSNRIILHSSLCPLSLLNYSTFLRVPETEYLINLISITGI